MVFLEIILILSLIATPFLALTEPPKKKAKKRELYYVVDEDGKIIWLEK